MNIMFDGLDNVGKSTQIKLLMKHLIDKPTHVIHYSAISGITPEQSYKYSQQLYDDMFYMMSEGSAFGRNLIFDRSHIGEYVYAPLYRNYSGEYVFDIEKKYSKSAFFNDIVLFVLVDKAENAISREDGHSFSIDIENKQKEIDGFKKAYELSYIKNKHLIDINGLSIAEVYNIIKKIILFDN